MIVRSMAGLAVLVLVACGGRTLATPSGAASPVPALVRGVLLRQGYTLEPAKVTSVDFEVPPRHNLHITVDWTFASNNVIVALTSSECPDIAAALAGGCQARQASWAPSFPLPLLDRRKPRLVTYDSINVTVPARLWIANAGATDESGVIDVRYCTVPLDCGQWGMCLACWGG